MKTIEFEVLIHNRKIEIYFGNAFWLSFPSKKSAHAYRVRLQSVIFENVVLLNDVFSSLYKEYRYNYHSLPQSAVYPLKSHLAQFEFNYDFIFKSFSEGNQNSFVFQKIEMCFSCLFDAIDVLKSYAHDYKQTTLRIHLIAKEKMLKEVYSTLQNEKQILEFPDTKNVIIKTLKKA